MVERDLATMRSSVEEPPNDEAGAEASASPEGPRRRRRRRRIEGPSAIAGEPLRTPAILLAVAVVGSVLAIGTVHVPVLAVVSLITFAAAAIALHRQAETPRGIAIPLPAIVLAALALYTLLQVVPMPMRWLETLAPANADVWQRSLLPFGEGGPRYAPISLDPGASLVEVLKWTTYAAAFLAAAAIAHRHGAVWGVLMVFGAGLAAALATLVHGVLGATKVYGLYQPKFNVLAWHIGPLLNANNLAGYLNLGALSGLGLLLSHRPPLPRWALGLGVALIVAIDVTSASRGGVLALPLGMIALALLARRRRKEETIGQSASTWLIVAAAAGGALLAALGGSSKAWSELLDKNLSKLTMLSWAKPLVRDHPIFGIGRGAFESVFPAYRLAPGNVVYTHAENFVAQWIAEWGLPIGVAAVVTFGWAFSPRRLGAHKSSLAAGAWAGVATLCLQNLVDLGLEIPAVSLGAVTVLGSLWGDERAHGAREHLRLAGPLTPRLARAPAVALALTGVAAILAVLRWGAHDVASDRARLRAMLDAAPSTRPEAVAPIRDELRRMMRAHPAEPYFPLLGGVIAFRTRDRSAIPWIQRTLERGRINGRAHYLLAEVLAARGSQKQALLSLRLALEADPLLLGPVATLTTRFSRSFEDMLTVAPEGQAGATVMAELGRLIAAPPKPGDPVLRSLCDREAIRRDPKLIGPHVREALVRLEALAQGSTKGVCADPSQCRAEVLEHADAIALAHPDASIAIELRARLLMAEQRPEEAVRLLDKGCDRVSDRPSCLRVRVEAASRVKAPAIVDAAAKDLLGAACVTTVACADTATWLAGVRSGRKEQGAALALLSRAAREDPSEERWLRVAEAASSSGAHVQAADAFEKVAKHRGGADPELRRRIEAERASALGGLLRR
jgi:hypothetical protein